MTEEASLAILLVDDEVAILRTLKRLFRKTGHRILAASSGREGLEILKEEHASVALIISDQRMPEMNGAQFLERAKKMAPDAMRILLTGYSELEALADSINKGEIHRYVTKPWEDNDLLVLVRQAIEQYELKKENQRLDALTRKQNKTLFELSKKLDQKVQARTRDLENKKRELEESLFNSVRSFASLMNLHSSKLAGHCRRVSAISGKMAEALELPEAQVNLIEIAGLLHDMGTIGLSANLITQNRDTWTDEEWRQYKDHPVHGQQVVQFINKLGNVGRVIRAHHERFDGQGFPDGLSEDKIPLGARIIAVADAYDRMVNLQVDMTHIVRNYLESLRDVADMSEKELSAKAAIHNIKQQAFTHYDPDLVKVLMTLFSQGKLKTEIKRLVAIKDLEPGMVLSQALYSVKGNFLLSKNARLIPEHIPKLKGLHDLRLIEDKIPIRAKQN